jgi:tetratricopeptide (TPR) repeat protein
MNKTNILLSIVFLLLGGIIGFTLANFLNRGEMAQNQAAPAGQPGPFATGANQTSAPAVKDLSHSGGGALPGVTEAIEKAKNEPQNFEAQMAAGEMYFQIRRYTEAAKYYEAANKLKPDSFETLVRLGNVYHDAAQADLMDKKPGDENFKLAEKWYGAALEKKPDDADLRSDLGSIFLLRDPPNVDRAIQEYQKALSVNAKHEPSLQNLCLAYRQKGDEANFTKALKMLEEANPNNSALQTLKQMLPMNKQ